jgi:hypothetical protein
MGRPNGMTQDRYVTRTETIVVRLLSRLQWVYETSASEAGQASC